MSEDGRGHWRGFASVTGGCAVAQRRTCARARTPPMIDVQVTGADRIGVAGSRRSGDGSGRNPT